MEQAVNIAVLDAVPEVYWKDDLGITDAQKFIDLLQPQNSAARFDVYYVAKDEFPAQLDGYDAILLSGSPCSVHDQHGWIARLMDLLRAANERKLRIIGTCFGHQLLARTFGGDVNFNEHGWLIGNYPVCIDAQYDWMQPPARTTGVYHFNQERVTRLPPGAVAFARTDLYDDYGFTLGDNILGVQGHPEQPHRAMVNYLNAMHSLSVEDRTRAERYIADGEPDAHIWGEWMMRFFVS